MPNDSTGEFPLPPKPIAPPSTTGDIKLTDEVAPDLTAAPTPVSSETSPSPVPVTNPLPATLPQTTPPPPYLTIILLLISVGAIAGTYFFYQQSKSLGKQLSEIEKTLNQQQTAQNQITPTPEATETPMATTSPTITPSTPTPLRATGLAFDNIKFVLATAQKQYPSAQLLMITSTGLEAIPNTTLKYWFRQNATSKKYLYLLKEAGKDYSLIDQQVYVTPDNNIPSLNQLAAEDRLGIDLDQAVKTASAACPTSFDCATSAITGQFIKSNSTIWQITFKSTSGGTPFVVQIDSATAKIIYKNQ